MKRISCCLLVLILLSSNIIFAATDEFKAFNTWDFNTTIGVETVSYGVRIFQKLGYINVGGTNTYTTTNSKSTILNYTSGTGRNYGIYVQAHGNSNLFTAKSGDSSQYIYPSDISGYWHLVFLDCCSNGASDNFANAFHTVGYTNRAFISWYTTVTTAGAREWIGYFYQYVGTAGLRSACLSAAGQCTNSTPIRMYGDKNWNGYAW